MRIKAYQTEIDNLYLVVSHGTDGRANTSYLLINEENNMAVEIISHYGPVTQLRHENLLDAYIHDYDKLDRGSWTQLGFDDANFNTMLSEGDLEGVARKMKDWLI